jgi:tripartite-type tricarboxylate transporter receptor subunit TctC
MTTSRRLNMRRTLTLAALSLLGLGTAIGSHAQAWPNKPIKIVVGFAPGGTTDVMARLMAQHLSESLGQSVVIDNKPGASGNIAAAEVARAAPDGYTLFISPTSVETANPSLFKSSPVLPSRDLTPVAGIGKTQMYLVAKPQTTAKDVRELVAQAKAQPGKLSYASAGAGTPPHLACELFKQATSTDIVHVPYRGAAPALQDVLSGQADFVCDPGIAFPHIRSGKAKLLAVVSEKRSPFFPDVPTVAEQGFRGNYMDIWFGMWAPNGTPADVVTRLSRELSKALAQPAVKARYADLGAENVALDPAEFRNLLAAEGRLLSGLIRDQKISVD